MNPNNYCLILAGGLGSRLWPVSQSTLPKQFLDIGGAGRTLIQQTYDRISRTIDPNNIFVSTLEDYLPILDQQLPQLPRTQVLAEPIRRGTLAPVAWATSAISRICPDARIIITPADQIIYDPDIFDKDIMRGLDFVGTHDGVVTIGARPSRPETAYGYVQAGEVVDEQARIHRVKTFTEKPNSDFAQMFTESGEFFWNTGLFLFGAHYMLHNIIKHVPEYRDEFPELADLGMSAATDIVPKFYSALPNLSMEYAVLERTGHNYLLKCDFRWADVGSWQSLSSDITATHTQFANNPRPASDVKADGRGNITMHCEALFDNAEENIVSLSSGQQAVISGLKGYVIAERGGIIMICPKDDPAAMRRLQTLAHMDALQ